MGFPRRKPERRPRDHPRARRRLLDIRRPAPWNPAGLISHLKPCPVYYPVPGCTTPPYYTLLGTPGYTSWVHHLLLHTTPGTTPAPGLPPGLPGLSWVILGFLGYPGPVPPCPGIPCLYTTSRVHPAPRAWLYVPAPRARDRQGTGRTAWARAACRIPGETARMTTFARVVSVLRHGQTATSGRLSDGIG